MPLFINVPDSANAEQVVSLGGSNYNFKFSYNSRDQRFRLSIYLGGVSVIEGMKLVESTNPTGKYDLVNFDHGQLFLVRIEDTGQAATRDNIGFDKPYRLTYLTNEEITEL